MSVENLSPLRLLSSLGQSAWIDFISRESIRGGHLQSLLDEDSVVGATSNPTIFEKAMTSGDAYEEQLRALDGGLDVKDVFWALAEQDIRDACDLFRPVWDAGGGRDGYVSLEVDPGLAYDTLATFREAIRIHAAVERPNLMVKIPATKPGLAAIEDAIAKGCSINVTLIFSLQRYAEVIDAFMAGLENAADRDVSQLGSVASFFVSRVDTEVDERLDKLGTPEAQALRGKAALANARLAYELYEQKFATARWSALSARGARVQRPLWASTSVKDPAFADTMYVVDLVAPNTVNTMPEATLHATQAHGTIGGDTIHGTYEESRRVFEQLEALGISYDDVVTVLENQGVQKFAASWNELLETIKTQMSAAAGSR
jgi:transaldolase